MAKIEVDVPLQFIWFAEVKSGVEKWPPSNPLSLTSFFNFRKILVKVELYVFFIDVVKVPFQILGVMSVSHNHLLLAVWFLLSLIY